MLFVAERRGRIPRGSSQLLVERLRRFGFLADLDQVDAGVITLARNHNLSGYDAEFLETAIRRNARLVTLDKILSAGGDAAGIPD